MRIAVCTASRCCFQHSCRPDSQRKAFNLLSQKLQQTHSAGRNMSLLAGTTSEQLSAHKAASSEYSVVYVTVPNEAVASNLAGQLLEKKLAACVSIIPGVKSMYWWEGKVATDAELLLMIKSKPDLLEQLTAHVKSNHPYDEPEVISVPITGGSRAYLKWLQESTQQSAHS